MNKKRMIINLVSNMLTFFASLLIGLYITPRIVEKLGNGAYSFIGISNEFVNNISIVTVALNSMAGRFISLELNRGNKMKASVYFNSVLVANIILSIAISIVSFVIILNIDKLLNISPELVNDVKITFGLVFFNLIASLATAVYSVAPFVTDRLDQSSIRNVFSNIIRIGILVPLFAFFPPKIYYVTLGVLGTTAYLTFTNFILTKRLLPEIKFNIKKFEFKAVKEILNSGIWNSLNQLGNVLLTGLALVITNIAIGENAAGQLSIAKTVPINIAMVIASVASIFGPRYVQLYAKGNIKVLLKEAKYAMKIIPLIMIVPIAGFLAFGNAFYSIWQHFKGAEEIEIIQRLSILSMGTNLMCIFVYPLSNINTTTNKLKWPVIVTFITGLVSTGTIFLLLKTTNVGVFAVNGVSTVFSMLRLFIFLPTYSASNLKLKLTSFYPTILRGIFSFGLVMVCFFFVNLLVRPWMTGWVRLFLVAGGAGLVGYIIVFFSLLSRFERDKVTSLVKNKLLKKTS